ncbi:MAG: redoxin family protein [Bdellovibrionales bacterium]
MKLHVFLAFCVLTFTGLDVWSLPHTVQGPSIIDGKIIKIEPSDKGIVVVFLSARCPCSMSHIPEVKTLAQKFPDFSFIGVHSNQDEPISLSRPYFAGLDLPFPVVEDEGATIANQFKALKTPHVFVVNKKGDVLFQGGMTNSRDCATSDEHYLQDALTDIQAGKKVASASVRTLGCAISRRK